MTSLLSNLPLADTEVLNNARIWWGKDLQIEVLEEELSELAEEITLAHIGGDTWTEGVCEELADVLVCLSQVEMVLRYHPTPFRRDCRTLWDEVEVRVASAELEDASPDAALLLYTIRLRKEFSKTRRYNGGSMVWSMALLTAIGEFLSCLSVVISSLCACRHGGGSYYDRVISIRNSKLRRLRDRLEEAKEAAAIAAEDREVV